MSTKLFGRSEKASRQRDFLVPLSAVTPKSQRRTNTVGAGVMRAGQWTLILTAIGTIAAVVSIPMLQPKPGRSAPEDSSSPRVPAPQDDLEPAEVPPAATPVVKKRPAPDEPAGASVESAGSLWVNAMAEPTKANWARYIDAHPDGPQTQKVWGYLTTPTSNVVVLQGSSAPCPASRMFNIYFNKNQSIITREGWPLVDRIAQYSQPSMPIYIDVHTDSAFADGYSMEITVRLAQSIVSELGRRGIDMQHVRAVAHGESNLRSETEDEVSEPLNRVAQFRVCTRA